MLIHMSCRKISTRMRTRPTTLALFDVYSRPINKESLSERLDLRHATHLRHLSQATVAQLRAESFRAVVTI